MESNYEARQEALARALELSRSNGTYATGEKIVEDAKSFEKFLVGENARD